MTLANNNSIIDNNSSAVKYHYLNFPYAYINCYLFYLKTVKVIKDN